jgi:hypothetical protein
VVQYRLFERAEPLWAFDSLILPIICP